MSHLRGLLLPLLVVACAWTLHACLSTSHAGGRRWWKGNTHTHTLWSDGDGAPELVADWYRRAGYDFLVLSDHNVLSRDESWFPVQEEGRLTPERVEELIERFGRDSVELRDGEAGTEMRLLTLEALRARFESPGEFLFIQGEEITDSFDGAPVHVNALNLIEPIDPPGGASLQETLQNAMDAVDAQSAASGKPMLAHVNHPNYGFALGWRELAALRGERFFEVYNGHPAVANDGDQEHESLERAWDRALTMRLEETDLGLLHGIASDDAHSYHEESSSLANAGRGWLHVRAASLRADDLVRAMRAGDFYASTGVTLEDFRQDHGRYEVDVDQQAGVHYRTRFVGTRKGTGEIGEVLFETDADPAVYELRGDEWYVRAVVESDREQSNPSSAGELERAWLPAMRGGARR